MGNDSVIGSQCETISATPWLQRLVDSIPIARAGQDPEGVHQLRVAIARLRVWLFLGRWQALRDDLRWLREQAASVRDLDVQLSKELPPSLARHLQARRLVARRELLQALSDPRIDGILLSLGQLPPVPRQDAVRRVGKLARGVLRRGRRALAHPKKLAALHTLRRATRRLRFALEWLGACPTEIVELQNKLGTVSDSIVALRHLKQLPPGKRGLDAYRGRIQDELRQCARAARHLWLRLEPELIEMAR